MSVNWNFRCNYRPFAAKKSHHGSTGLRTFLLAFRSSRNAYLKNGWLQLPYSKLSMNVEVLQGVEGLPMIMPHHLLYVRPCSLHDRQHPVHQKRKWICHRLRLHLRIIKLCNLDCFCFNWLYCFVNVNTSAKIEWLKLLSWNFRQDFTETSYEFCFYCQPKHVEYWWFLYLS